VKSVEFLKEEPVDSSTGDYQQMLAFVRSNRVNGVPADQQMPLALFKELKKQQQRSQALSAELNAAEKRIELAAQRGDNYEKQLSRHQDELDREHQDIEQQQATLSKIDQQYASKAQASQKQIQSLTDKLNDIKGRPGVDADTARALERQIQDISKNGVSAEKFKQLEQNISAVQNMNRVDGATVQDLMAQVNAAQTKAEELGKTKQAISQDLEKATQDAHDQIEQIKQQLARFREVEQTVSALQPMVQDVLAPKVDELSKSKELADKIARTKLNKKFAASIEPADKRNAMADMANASLVRPDLGNMLMKDPRAVGEDRFFQAVKWATSK
jgi:chromosome segregation ATPase